jgi:hypothetical protein
VKTCILIPSYEKYRVLAGFTASQIDRHWRDHPPIYFCGLSAPTRKNDAFLLLRRDSDDWLSILIDAVREVQERGFKAVYLILDDHPPLGPCEANTLNQTLPATLERLEAGTISLFRPELVDSLEKELVNEPVSKLERLPESYLWRYSLHPGLWSLSVLAALLSQLDTILLTPDTRNPWAFERVGAIHVASTQCVDIGLSYRISHAHQRTWNKDGLITVCYESLGNCARKMAGSLGGPEAWERVSHRFDFAYHFCGGPYPMFWRGIMEKGRPNQEFRRFCRFFLKWDLMRRVAQAIQQIDGQTE